MSKFPPPPIGSETIGWRERTQAASSATGSPHGETGSGATQLAEALKGLQTAVRERAERDATSSAASSRVPQTSSMSAKALAEVKRREDALRPSTPQQIAAELAKVAAVVILPDNASPKTTFAIYAEHLCPYPLDLVQAACAESIRTNKFFPTIAELIGLMAPRVKHRREMLDYARRDAA